MISTDVKSSPARRNRSAVKRERITRAAAKLFLERGYDSVSINDIINVVGGSKGTIYSHFGGKEELFAAVVREMCSNVTIRIDTRPTGTVEQQLTRIGISFVTEVMSPSILRFHRLMISIGRTFPDAGRLFYNTGPRTVHRLIAEWIALQQANGGIRSREDPHQLAILFHDMLIGEQHLSWLTSASSERDRTKRIRQKVQLAVKIFLRGASR